MIRFLRGALLVFATSGAAMLAWCGYVLIDTWRFQQRELAVFAARPMAAGAPSPPAVEGGLIGHISIPRLGVSAAVLEGTGNVTLRRAVGHIAGTALPGRSGNVGLSAHRDTFFRPLRNVRENDIVTLTTAAGEYRYRVVSTKIVSPDDVSVLDPGNQEVLTLVTCYPFYFVGPAPRRFIVRAVRVGAGLSAIGLLPTGRSDTPRHGPSKSASAYSRRALASGAA
jgi:sortase A